MDRDSDLRFVIITGLSGAGKSYAIKCMEDMGFFCVDNLPTTLIPTFADLITESSKDIGKIALGVDIREGEYLNNFIDILSKLKMKGYHLEVLFLEASEETLIRRYSETRRKHPLAGNGTVLEGIREEKKRLVHLREMTDRCIDTTHINVHQLKEILIELYGDTKQVHPLMISLISFGYRYGIPFDADLVFDVRMLPNPFFNDSLKGYDGNDERIADFIFDKKESKLFIEMLCNFINSLIPMYKKEGKFYLTIAIGCTGGRHRSVAVSNRLKDFLEKQGYLPVVKHRDIDKE